MFNKINIYIGSNNETHKLEKAKAIEVISEYFDGFTAYEVIGYWKGIKEKTLKVEIAVDSTADTTIIQVCKQLKELLHQEAIMVEKISSSTAFIE